MKPYPLQHVPVLALLFIASNTVLRGADQPPRGSGPAVLVETKGAAGLRSTAQTQALLVEFDHARAAYLVQRDAHKGAGRTATEQQRQALREQVQAERREQFQAREQLRSQLRELRERLPSHRDLIDSARERVGSRPRRGD